MIERAKERHAKKSRRKIKIWRIGNVKERNMKDETEENWLKATRKKKTFFKKWKK